MYFYPFKYDLVKNVLFILESVYAKSQHAQLNTRLNPNNSNNNNYKIIITKTKRKITRRVKNEAHF